MIGGPRIDNSDLVVIDWRGPFRNPKYDQFNSGPIEPDFYKGTMKAGEKRFLSCGDAYAVPRTYSASLQGQAHWGWLVNFASRLSAERY